MPMRRSCRLTLLLTAGLIAVLPRAASAQGTITFNSQSIVGASADALAAGPDGSLWFISQFANTVGRVTFPDLTVTTFKVPTANSGLASITAGPDGKMWFTESTAKKIGRIDATGTFAEFPTPAGSQPPQKIFPGPNGTLWATSSPFFDFGGSNFFVITTVGASTLLTVNAGSKSYKDRGCALGPDGNVWCFGEEQTFSPFSSVRKIARITPTGGYTAFAPPTDAQGATIVGAPDGNVWYTWLIAPPEKSGVARITPAGVITEYTITTNDPRSWIYGLTVGADGNLYFDDRGHSKIYQLILSTAAGTGQPTINSGTIPIDTPEQLVAVSNQAGNSSRSAEAAAASCPAVAFVARSGGSPTGSLEWEPIATPRECTDLRASLEFSRRAGPGGKPLGYASCEDLLYSPNPAKNAVLTIALPPGSLAGALVAVALVQGWVSGSCDPDLDEVDAGRQPGGSFLQCTSPLISQGQRLEVFYSGTILEGAVEVNCSSSTPEIRSDDNNTKLGFGLPPDNKTIVGVSKRGRQ